MALSQEQRRALRLLLHTSPYGCDKSMLLARGLKIELLSGLVRDGFAEMNLLPIPWVDPVDVSNAIVWLASDAARYVTGVTLPVDAGNHLKC